MIKQIIIKIENCYQCKYAQYEPALQHSITCELSKKKFNTKTENNPPDWCVLDDFKELK